MSAFTLLATFERTCRDVCLVPTTDITGQLFDHLVGAGEYRWRDVEVKSLGSPKIYNERVFRWLLNRKIAGFHDFRNWHRADIKLRPLFGRCGVESGH